MRIQCDVCQKAEAEIMCSADEAALCLKCDKQVHEANKLASKHPRVPLVRSATDSPRCDICQDKVAYFFCLQDRALLCRACDVSIHSANALSSSHCRFLVTGAMVRAAAPVNGVEEECSPRDPNTPSSKVALKEQVAVPETKPTMTKVESMDLISTWLMDETQGPSKTYQLCGDFDLDMIFDDYALKSEPHEVPRTPSPKSKLVKPKPKRVSFASNEEDDSFLVPDLG